MLMFLDDTEIQKLERELKLFNDRGMPFATLDTLNRAVVGGQKRLQHGGLKKDFTLRNKWTKGSIQVRRARGLVIDAQAAELGSAAEYLAEQEEGFTRRARRKHGVPVPTAYAGGQGASRARTRPVRKPMRWSNIHLSSRARLGKTKKQQNVRAVQEAVKTGNRFAFLEFKKKKGIYRVIGGSKKTKRGWPEGARLKLVWSLTHRTTTTKPHRWLGPESEIVEAMIPMLYRRALLKQLKRAGFA
jgi:hypothetical protein